MLDRQSGVIDWLQSDLGKMALAGAAGGLVRWLTLRESPVDGLVAVLVGAICAIYLGPLVEPVLEPVIGAITSDRSADGFSSFVVGLGGIGLAGMLIDVTRRYRGREGVDGEQG